MSKPFSKKTHVSSFIKTNVEHDTRIIPDKHENISSNNTRNKHNYFIPRCRLELFKNLLYLIQ